MKLTRTLVTCGAAVVTALSVAACATGNGTLSPEEEVAAQVGAWAAAMEAHDLDAVMAMHSEDFEHYEYGTKQSYGEYMGQVIEDGLFDGLVIITDDMDIEVDGTRAAVYPIDMQAAFGGATVELVFEEEADGVWRITTMDVQLF